MTAAWAGCPRSPCLTHGAGWWLDDRACLPFSPGGSPSTDSCCSTTAPRRSSTARQRPGEAAAHGPLPHGVRVLTANGTVQAEVGAA